MYTSQIYLAQCRPLLIIRDRIYGSHNFRHDRVRQSAQQHLSPELLSGREDMATNTIKNDMRCMVEAKEQREASAVPHMTFSLAWSLPILSSVTTPRLLIWALYDAENNVLKVQGETGHRTRS